MSGERLRAHPRRNGSAGEPRFDDVPLPAQRHSAAGPVLKPLDVFLAEYEPLEYALEPIIRTGSLYTLTAKTGAGKTAWLISVALAAATGRGDILGMDVEQGRVALLTFENPDDVRMRLKVSSWLLNVDVAKIVDQLLILDARVKPEEASRSWTRRPRTAAAPGAHRHPRGLLRRRQHQRQRPGRRLHAPPPAHHAPAGRPAVVVAAHPVKNAPQDNLLPYGGGAILNEVDGNLTLWRRSEGTGGIVELHWQGKLRGLEFDPIPFRFEITTSPEVKDAKGREVALPTMLPVTVNAVDIEAREQAESDISIALMKAMQAAPKATQRQWADAIQCPVSTLGRRLHKLKDEKLVDRRDRQMEPHD